MKINKYFSVNKIFIIIILPVVYIISGLIFFVIEMNDIKFKYDELEHSSQLEVSSLSQALSEPLWNIDRERIQNIVKSSLSKTPFVGIRIIDDFNNVFLEESFYSLNIEDNFREISTLNILKYIIKNLNKEHKHDYLFSSNIVFETDSNMKDIGIIELIASDSDIFKDIIKEIRLFLILTFFISTFLIISILFVYKIVVVQPLSDLKTSLELALSQNSADFKINKSNNEFLYLKNVFESLWNYQNNLLNKLIKSEQFLNETDSIAKIGGWELDIISGSLFWTDQVYDIYELSTDYKPNLRNIMSFFDNDMIPEIERAFDLASKKGQSFDTVVKLRTAKNNDIWVQIIGNNVGDNDHIRGTIQDVTQRKELELEAFEIEKQISHQSKIDILGHLAGSVAHDFNNILAGIQNSAYLLSTKIDTDDSLQKYISIILNSSINGSKIASKLLTFSRKDQNKEVNTDLNNLIIDSIKILETIIDKNINVIYEYRGNSISSIIDYSSVQNALLNIGINSSHAMPSGGEIKISLNEEVIKLEDCKLRDYELKPGNYASITIEDEGLGIPKEIIDKVFEPFFTTKKNGLGTGLGLAAVRRSMLESNGGIVISSTLNEGTIIKLLIPISETLVQDQQLKVVEENRNNSGVILFVDDEEVNRITAKDLLESYGYDVLIAANGKEALDIFNKNMNLINIVILDMIMPILDGEETFRRIKKVSKDIPVLICSGYSKSEKITELLNEGLNGIIDKPFIIKDLIETISQYI